ncbi:hypothetical protein BU16DRAFT_471712 [Lophium mytilinum]|uniref:Zn(2)-C6 fungal-type domain-containing protein n=1 Tax=Lophium mytilinum TaxID=390894 RepID=A0A6A6QBZ2_9PEZI|nr:hypothetical protein BU16DRAFT_471712 [Lophium mytilinum]
MTTKRPYKKSISGCRTCKRRRVKCNEARPQCGQCSKHGVVCDFANTPSSATSASSRSSSTSPSFTHYQSSLLGPLSQPTAIHPLYDDTMSSRMMELRLMHHSTAVAWSMGLKQAARWKVWSEYVPMLAFQGGPSNPLLDLILANSALHLHILNPTDPSFKLVSSKKFAQGLEKMKALLSQVNEENSPAAFAASALISLHVLVYRQEKLSGIQFQPASDFFRAVHGTRSITAHSRSWIQNSDFKALLLDEPSLLNDPAAFSGWVMTEDSPFAELLFGLDDEPLGCKKVAMYKTVIRYLSWAFTSYLSGEDTHFFRRKVLGFPVIAPSQFVDLLEAHDPRTLAITAHFFGLSTFLNDIWWFQGVADREIPGLFSLMPPEWAWAMSWPLQQINKTPKTLQHQIAGDYAISAPLGVSKEPKKLIMGCF